MSATEVLQAAENIIHDPATHLRGCYEPETTQAVLGLIKPGHVCVDVGANIGWYTALMARLAGPTGIVVAFEPIIPHELRAMQRELVLTHDKHPSAHVHAYAMALGNTVGIKHFRRYKEAWTLLKPEQAEAVGDDLVIQVTKLDVMRSQLPRAVDVIKIDVDGHEVPVLEGGEDTLRRDKPVLVLEVAPDYWRLCGYEALTGLKMLEGLGYKFFGVTDGRQLSAEEIAVGVPKWSSWNVVCRV